MNARQSALAVLALAVLLTLVNSVFAVDQRSKTVLLQFGRLVGGGYQPGLHFKLPYVQNVKRFDGRLLSLPTDVATYRTADKKSLEVESYVKWRIVDANAYYLATGGQELSADGRLKAIVNEVLSAQFAERTVAQAVGGGREQLLAALRGTAADKLKELGVEIVDLGIKSVALPKNIADAAYERMRAERALIAAKLRAEGEEQSENIRSEGDRSATALLADAYKQAESLRGEGDAKAAEIYARAYGQDPDFASFYRSLAAYRQSFKDQKDVLVIEPRGEFFKYFKDQNGR